MEKRKIATPSLSRTECDRIRSSCKFKAFLFVCFLLFGIFSCGREKAVEPGSRSNSPPQIASVKVLPENPAKKNDLNVIIQSNDPDGDPVTYEYHWVRNDQEIPGETSNVLRPQSFGKGDLIQVRVTPSDGKVAGRPVVSSPVKISNSPPVIAEVWIEPKIATVRDNLKAIVKSVDDDGDFVYATYEWEKNGAHLPEERGEVLEKGRFKKGDVIAVTVTPDDREVLGKPKKSESITLANGPPVIISSPPVSADGNVYVYQVKVDDPDGDPVTFSLKSAPQGMQIDEKTGLIRWEIRREHKGVHPVEIEVSDSGGAKSLQQYRLSIDFK
jgi:hypothetical protein